MSQVECKVNVECNETIMGNIDFKTIQREEGIIYLIIVFTDLQIVSCRPLCPIRRDFCQLAAFMAANTTSSQIGDVPDIRLGLHHICIIAYSIHGAIAYQMHVWVCVFSLCLHMLGVYIFVCIFCMLNEPCVIVIHVV